MERFKNILFIVEEADQCALALERAVTLAENNQAILTVVSVIPRVTAGLGMPNGGPISADLQAAMTAAQTHKLHDMVAPYRARIDMHIKVLLGIPFLEIIREVLGNGRDLVIKIPEAVDWLDRLFGSDDMHLLRKCPCPVWMIKPSTPKAYRRILAAVDVDDEHPPAEHEARCALNRRILEIASSLALSDFAELHIVHAWDAVAEGAMRGPFINTPEAEIIAYTEQLMRHHANRLDELIHEANGNLGEDALVYLKPRTHLVKGWARKEIPRLARRIEADLIIMGTVARIGVPGLIIGNTAECILGQIDCSVLAIKPRGFATPVTLDA